MQIIRSHTASSLFVSSPKNGFQIFTQQKKEAVGNGARAAQM